MAYEIGRLQNIMIGLEAVSWGTKAAAPIGLPVMTFSPNQKITYAKNNSRLGVVDTNHDSKIVRKWSEPSLSCIVDHEVAGYLFKAIFGSAAVAGPTDSSYTHTFTILQTNSQAPSLTLIYKDGNKVKMITGAIVNTATITLVQEDYIKIELTFMGKFPATTTQTMSYPTFYEYCGGQSTVKFATNLAGLGAASVIDFETASFEITKNAVLKYKLGDTVPYIGLSQNVDMKGNFTIVHKAATYFDLIEAGTKKAIRFTITDTGRTIGAGTNPSITLDLAQVNLEDWDEPDTIDELKMETFGWTSEYSVSDTKSMTCAMVNSTASYP